MMFIGREPVAASAIADLPPANFHRPFGAKQAVVFNLVTLQLVNA
jgi:hypothetical protein